MKFNKLADWLLRYPFLWIGFILIATVILGSFARNVRPDFTLEQFYPRNDPEVEYFRWFKEEFEPDDNIFMIGFQRDDLWTNVQVWQDIDAMSTRFEEIEGVTEVISLTTWEDIRGAQGELIVEQIVEQLPTSPAELARLKERVLDDPLLGQFLISTDGRSTAIFVEIDSQSQTYESRAAVIRELQAITGEYTDYDFHYSGVPYIRNTYVDLMQAEQFRANSLVAPLAIIFLFLAFRNVRGILLPLAVIIMSVIWAVGWMGLFRVNFDMMTTIMPSILIVVGLADSIHLMLKYHEERDSGKDRKTALRATIEKLGMATFMTSLTTAVGFAALISASIVPMRNFGTFTALGVLGAFVISIIFLTLTMMYLKPLRKDRGGAPKTGLVERWLQQCQRVTEQKPKMILATGVLVIGVVGLGILRIDIDTHMIEDVSESSQVIQDLRFFESEMSGVVTMEIILTGSELGAAKSPKMLSAAENLEGYLRGVEGIKSVLSPALIIKDLNQAMHDGDPTFYTIPDSQELIAQYLLLASLSGKDPFENYITYDETRCRVTARMLDVGSKKSAVILAGLKTFIGDNLPPEYDVRVTGTTKLIQSVNRQVSYDLVSSLALAFGIVSILMALLFRSLRWVVLSLIPNVVPLLIIAGTMGYLGIRLRSTTAAVFSVAFGIAVDDTIHFLSRIKLELNEGYSLEEASRNSLLYTGKAIVLTSLLLIVGFGILLISDFRSSFEFGLLSVLTILSALLADLYLLPVLIRRYGWSKK
ncbi:RND family transporter [Candidatus Neomarinimicrobiota bacterium]